MRVLAIAQSGTLGGAERSLLRIARRLPEHGIEVEITSPRGPLAEAASRLGIAVHPLELGPVNRGYWLPAVVTWPLLRQRVRRIAPDVFLLNGVVAHRAVPALQGAPRVPFVHERLDRPPLPWRSKAFWKTVPLALCGAPNVARAAAAAGAPDDRLRVVGAPFEPAEPAARPAWADGRPVVGFVGRLDPAKAPLDLLTALSQLPSEVRLVMVGDAAPGTLRGAARRQAIRYAERVRAEADRLGDRVTMLGQVGAAAPLMPWFDVLAVPSRHEGFGLVAAEAMAAGSPVVLTREVGIAEMIGSSGAAEVIPSADPAALAAALGRVLSRRDQYAAPAPSAAAEFSADRVAARVANALREAVA